MSISCRGKHHLTTSNIDEHASHASLARRSNKRVSLSPRSLAVTPVAGDVDCPADASLHDDGSSDGEVEFLYTNPAPLNSYPEMNPPQCVEDIESDVADPVDPGRDPPTELTISTGLDTNERHYLTPPVTARMGSSTNRTSRIQERQFSHRSSAYLQSLAEICHAVLWDARWRVATSRRMSQQQRLFDWERGDDMSAVHALARMYLPLTDLPHESGQLEDIKLEELSDGGSQPTDRLLPLPSDSTNAGNYTIEHTGDADTQQSDEDLDRCLETYSRLYFRKGPWFRLDNIFTSYYQPKMEQSVVPSTSYEMDLKATSSTTTDPITPKTPTSPSKFFLPVSQRRDPRGTNSTNKKETPVSHYIDQDYIDRQLGATEDMLSDTRRLLLMGLVRSFQTEEECGKYAGSNGPYESGILRQDEQRELLNKLGGQQRKRPLPSNSVGSTSSTNSSTTTSRSTPKATYENLIWKQMCQQQAILKSFYKNDDKNMARSYQHVLPVVKHVNRILIEKWATGIILKASKVEYIPSSVLRSATRSIAGILHQMTNIYGLSDSMCISLREAPLQTLRRVSRLYLCATSGPGDMRGDGTNAWRALPDSHTKERHQAPMRTNSVPPPGSHSWHSIVYPGKDWRMRLISCCFINAHIPMPAGDGNNDVLDNGHDICVFPTFEAFKRWELGVDVRANVDYLLEVNDLLLYSERKNAREKEKELDGDHSQSNAQGQISRDTDSINENFTATVDYMELLTIQGRAKVVSNLLNARRCSYIHVADTIERDISEILGTSIDDLPLSALVGMPTDEVSVSPGLKIEKTRLQNECERILGVVALILIHVLEKRNVTASSWDISNIVDRPWLRHMSWEGCMAYVLWDVIPILERRGYYTFAVNALEVLIFGARMPKGLNGCIPNSPLELASYESSIKNLAQSLLSRRARGKAYERLIIDYTHVKRKSAGKDEAACDKKAPTKGRGGRSNIKLNRKTCQSTQNEIVMSWTKSLLKAHVPTGQITFAATRTLARRLKCTLSSSLQDLMAFETNELGHRFDNGISRQDQAPDKYSDWVPVTDTAVANAMNSHSNAVGGRCAYIGFEDDEVKNIYSGSLNVEELAMEYYNRGILPTSNHESKVRGGWVGWHDEGGQIRTLFRILCASTLGMDWGGLPQDSWSTRDKDSSTLFLTPYQGAPFDLHVGAELRASTSSDSPIQQKGIYNRMRPAIDKFLDKLSSLTDGEVADLVYDNINERLKYLESVHRIDPLLEKDVSKVRTLSILAAGFGGKMLSAMFRCFFFDYRHYSGGLPDLLLVRAIYTSPEDQCTNQLVDLGDWVGESFSKEYQDAIKAQKIAQVFLDNDGEFLGCSKVGDSGGRSINKWNKPGCRNAIGPKRTGKTDDDRRSVIAMPDRLSLCHNDRRIRVECMCVEVKSQNDRLDPRQEDWLNILDRFGNARVCKFEKPKRPKGVNNKENGSSSANAKDSPVASSS
jgi:hypothetical protein